MTKSLQPLKDKIALVVGGSRGIGAGIVRRLAEDGAGIALTYAAAADKANELVQQIAAGGVRAIAIKADSGNEAELRDAVAKTMQQFGRLDILVVNAGVLIHGGILNSAWKTSTAYWPSMCAEWSLPSRLPLPTWGKAVASLPSAATRPCEPASRARASTR